jgi:quercetin dioxygenase-like cupin family protein
MKEYNEESPGDSLGLTRRGLLTGVFPAFLTYALLGEAARAAARAGKSEPHDWIDQQQELAEALAAGQVTPLTWCQEVETLSRQVDIAELLAVARLAADDTAKPGGSNDPQKRVVRFVDASGRQQRLSYGAALFAFQPTNVITPHAHRNMVSAHLVVDGTLRIRTYDRVRDEKSGIVIKPAEDFVAGVGKVTTMCTERHNVHWFVPQGGPAMTLDVVIDGLSGKGESYEITALDPLGGKALKDGSILAPTMSFEAAAAKYTADV